MRELSQEEESFIRDSLVRRKDIKIHEDNNELKISKKVPKKVFVRHFWGRPLFWGGLFILLPLSFIGMFTYSIYHIQSVLGASSLGSLIESDSETLNSMSQVSGLTWLPQFIEVYKQKTVIFGGIFTGLIIIIAVIIIWDIFVLQSDAKKHEKEEEKNEENES
jgi:hypothetical protein